MEERCLADKLRIDHNDTPLIWLVAYSPIVPAILDDGVRYSRRSF